MATTAEKQALAFLAVVALTGAAVQAVGVQRFDSAAAHATKPASGVRGQADSAGATLGAQALAGQLAAIDSARAAGPSRRGKAKGGGRRAKSPAPPKQAPEPPPLIDINAATAAEIERLPRVGPALAERIVAWRTEHGPYAGPEDLRHVRGIGPATVRLILPLVTFSGRHRPLLSEGPPYFASFLTTPSDGHPGTWQLLQLL